MIHVKGPPEEWVLDTLDCVLALNTHWRRSLAVSPGVNETRYRLSSPQGATGMRNVKLWSCTETLGKLSRLVSVVNSASPPSVQWPFCQSRFTVMTLMEFWGFLYWSLCLCFALLSVIGHFENQGSVIDYSSDFQPVANLLVYFIFLIHNVKIASLYRGRGFIWGKTCASTAFQNIEFHTNTKYCDSCWVSWLVWWPLPCFPKNKT